MEPLLCHWLSGITLSLTYSVIFIKNVRCTPLKAPIILCFPYIISFSSYFSHWIRPCYSCYIGNLWPFQFSSLLSFFFKYKKRPRKMPFVIYILCVAFKVGNTCTHRHTHTHTHMFGKDRARIRIRSFE